MTAALARYETARAALAAAHRVDEVKTIRDKAQAMAAYAKQARDTQMVQWATEIKVRAERRCGEMLRDSAETGQRAAAGGDGRNQHGGSSHGATTLRDLGITRDQSSRFQKLAAMPAEHFETAVETAKATAGAVTSAHMMRLADELRATRELQSTLEKARRGLDRASRADAAWRPLRLALTGLHARVEEARRLPACPTTTKAELLAMWAAVSQFFSTQAEDQDAVQLRRVKRVTLPVADPERAVRILLKSCEQRDLFKLLSELGYTLHCMGAISNWKEAMREMLARDDVATPEAEAAKGHAEQ